MNTDLKKQALNSIQYIRNKARSASQLTRTSPLKSLESRISLDFQTPNFNSDFNKQKINTTGIFFDENAVQISKDYISKNSYGTNERFRIHKPKTTITNINKDANIEPIGKKVISVRKNSLVCAGNNKIQFPKLATDSQ